jgi:phosphopantetheinyl transferase (holo-ACP synthase)
MPRGLFCQPAEARRAGRPEVTNSGLGVDLVRINCIADLLRQHPSAARGCLAGKSGAPFLELCGSAEAVAGTVVPRVSISHDGGFAIAIVQV